jgi:NADH dehydrogenase
MSEQIVVVGGGFAGFWACLAARRAGAEQVAVTLVSRDPVLQVRPRLYEADPASLGLDLLPLLATAGVSFVAGDAVALDCARNTVGLASGGELRYGRLVVATGSVLRRPPIPGADEAYTIDTQGDAIAFDTRLAEVVRQKARPVIVVVGAGFTGIELALELRDRVMIHGGGERAEGLRIVLVDRAGAVGPELGAGPRPAIEAALAEARVELRLGANIAALGANRLTFSDGTAIEADAVVLTTGMTAAGFARLVPGERDELGRIIVDRSLRASSAREIFVAGDAAAADIGDGHHTLQSCQHALQLGRFAGENAARDLVGLPPVPYVQLAYVTCLDLGRSGAVLTRGFDRTVAATGAEAKARKQRINTEVIYPPAGASREELLALSSLDPAEQRLSRPLSPATR